VDDPQCRADCESHGLTFIAYVRRKSGSSCDCNDGTYRTVHLHSGYNVTGGHSAAESVLDFFIRAAAFLGGAALWYALLAGIAFAARALFRRRHGATR
jgi:hypothetical protein